MNKYIRINAQSKWFDLARDKLPYSALADVFWLLVSTAKELSEKRTESIRIE